MAGDMTGASGPSGPTGDTQTGTTGSAAATGPETAGGTSLTTGAALVTGLSMATGASIGTGLTAADGSTGASGSAGVTGPTGVTGATAPTGTTAATGTGSVTGTTSEKPVESVLKRALGWTRTRKAALVGLVIATLLWVIWSQLANGFGQGLTGDDSKDPHRWDSVTHILKDLDDDNTVLLLGWIVAIAILLGLTAVLGCVVTGRRDGIFLDEWNRLSLSKLQVVLWTGLILSAFLAAGLWNVARNEANPLDISIPAQVWALVGLSIVTGVSATFIKLDMNDNAAKPEKGDGSWDDLFKGDRKGNQAYVDVGKAQMFLFTAIAVITYSVALGSAFIHPDSTDGKIERFPELTNGLVALVAASHAGYLAFKQIAPSK